MNPTTMAVEFGLFHHDVLVCRSTVRIGKQQKSEEFDYAGPSDAAGNASKGHLVIQHQFGLPAASLYLRLIPSAPPESVGEMILEAALEMGIHESEDWESVILGEDYTFAFRCRLEGEPAHL